MAYTSPEPLRGKHDFGGFDCGEESLNSWLHRRSRHAEAARSSRVYVTTNGPVVVGYYALTVGEVQSADGTPRLLKGQPVGRSVPVAILARLAVDQNHQGHGVGRSLLQDALLRTALIGTEAGIRALIVHSHPEARAFYASYGFESSPTDPMHLILLMKDLEKLIAENES